MKPRSFLVDTDRKREFVSAFLLRQPIPFQCDVGPIREHRTTTQNARLWKLHTMASEVTGYTPEECHEEMLCQHFGSETAIVKNPWNGEMETKRRPLKRSSARDKKEFARFMDFVEMFYGEKLGVWLPND